MTPTSKKIILSLVVLIGVSVWGTHTALAVGGFVPLADLGAQGGSKLSNLYGSNGLRDYVNALFTFALSLGAILAVLRIAYAGYMYMGTDSWGNKSEAKKIIGDVVVGLLLLLSIWLILNQINPHLLDLNVLSQIN